MPTPGGCSLCFPTSSGRGSRLLQAHLTRFYVVLVAVLTGGPRFQVCLGVPRSRA